MTTLEPVAAPDVASDQAGINAAVTAEREASSNATADAARLAVLERYCGPITAAEANQKRSTKVCKKISLC